MQSGPAGPVEPLCKVQVPGPDCLDAQDLPRCHRSASVRRQRLYATDTYYILLLPGTL